MATIVVVPEHRVEPIGEVLQAQPLQMLDDARVHEIVHGTPPTMTAA